MRVNYILNMLKANKENIPKLQAEEVQWQD